MEKDIIDHYATRVGYSENEFKTLQEGGHRIRHIKNLSKVASQYSIRAEVIDSHNCNSGHIVGEIFIMDIDGNFITKYCPKKMCVYLISQLTIPVALINERLGEGLEPNEFHFMREVRCPDAGIDCMGYGSVMLRVQVIPRVKNKI